MPIRVRWTRTSDELGPLPPSEGEGWGEALRSLDRSELLTPTLTQPKSGLPGFGHFKCRTRASRVRVAHRARGLCTDRISKYSVDHLSSATRDAALRERMSDDLD